MLEQFLWGYFPYIVLTIFVGGHIYRYQHDQFGWTTKSSEFLEKKSLRLGSILFHWGIIFVFIGHVMGILIPKSFYDAIGISEHTYHTLAIAFGLPAGIVSIVGLVIFIQRRLTVKRIRLTSSKADWLVLILLAIVMLTGFASTSLNVNANGFDYRTTISPWFRTVLTFRADPTYMENVPIWFKIHIVSALCIFVVWPFTRLVHVFSMPFRYLSRSYVVYRRRMPKQQ
ncbi:respiratory nitrate reductase subunit gamma [Anoxybacillus ayderensis]|uniref:respiratory nitrate reductase subunit gamma n=1 Tax=Anoxybacillus ayderensis TaxID=265546 RepID=UPI002E22747F|nr:respiratory nitrate reductase subunit gamma [Anoxybacillus ayderensis]MED0687540.1 respiratory nitrate reductase subunit gamma [Anoxybacillus ayderensis]